jgi:ABC-type multidrug transport system ATPase subunit
MALFEVNAARVDVDGVPAVDGLSLATTGDRVLVLGAARALFEAASGVRRIARGEVRVEGTSAVEALRAGRVAGAPLDSPLPPTWTALEYAAWSARLAGHARAEARSLASEAIDRMKLAAVADAPLSRAPEVVRRATSIAAAIATGASVIALDDPLSGLADDQARSLAHVVTAALGDRKWIVFAARVALSSPLALQADEAIYVSGSAVIAQGAPAELASRERAFAVRVHGDTAAFARRVIDRGGKVGGTAAQMTVDLGDLTTGDLVRLAEETSTVILELYPLAGCFA